VRQANNNAHIKSQGQSAFVFCPMAQLLRPHVGSPIEGNKGAGRDGGVG